MVSTQASGVASVYPPAKTNQNIIGLDAKERIHEASRRILINVIAHARVEGGMSKKKSPGVKTGINVLFERK